MKNESKKIVITADSLIKVKHKKRVSFRIEWEVVIFIMILSFYSINTTSILEEHS